MPRSGRRSPARRPGSWWGVMAVIGILLLASGALAVALPDEPVPETARTVGLAAMFAAMFAVAEIFVLHVQVRREAQTVALSEIPLVLGLTFLVPHVLVVTLLVGAATAYVLHRHQRGLKLAYNVSLKACDGLVAVTVYRLLLGDDAAFGWRWLLACYVVAATVSLVDGLTTQLVIGLHEGAMSRAVLRDVAIYPIIGLVVTTVPVVIAFALDRSLLAALPAAVAAAGLVGGYRAYSRLNDRHLSLERLYRFSQAVTSTPEVNETLGHVLNQAKELLRSEHAEISFFAGQGTAQVRVALSPSGRLVRESVRRLDDVLADGDTALTEPLLLARGTKDPRHRDYLLQRRWREAIVVPLRGDAGVIGTLSVADRMGEVRRFHLGDMRLLETVANHAGMALQNSRLIDQLRHESLHDSLTGLPNRVLLRNAVSEQLDQVARRRSVGAAVMIMDLDGFKDVNDTLGHQHGDELLKVVAGRTVVAAGEQCTVARLGGDEFALLVPDCADAGGAHDVAVRVLTALRSPTVLDGVPVQVGASIGVALAPRHATDVGGLLRFADVAMYAAKSSGGGVKVYEADSDTSSPDRLAMATELRNALERGEIGIAVQPQARLSDATVASVEVLARWENPRRGLMLPGDFIPLVERLGLIHHFTVHVLRVALGACAAWRANGEEVSIAVNLSARSLAEPSLCATVSQLLAESRVPPHLLTLEMTESTVMADPDEAVRSLQALRDLGVRLSIDDFGVGYSSLSSLSRLPVQELKIDRSFVAEQDDTVNNAVIIRSIVDLGRNLGLDVVAEGVETETAWARLEQLGCHYAQGYLVGRPMSPEDLLVWLARWRTGRGPVLAGRRQEAVAGVV